MRFRAWSLAADPRRYRFTRSDHHRMAQTGIRSPDARVELIDGEIIEMSPNRSQIDYYGWAPSRWVSPAPATIVETLIAGAAPIIVKSRGMTSVQLGNEAWLAPELAI